MEEREGKGACPLLNLGDPPSQQQQLTQGDHMEEREGKGACPLLNLGHPPSQQQQFIQGYHVEEEEEQPELGLLQERQHKIL
jgi:hypothetical protein